MVEPSGKPQRNLVKAAEAAQVTFTVTQFRPLLSAEENRCVDAAASLAPHSSVTLVNRVAMPTFICKEAVDFEITLVSADPKETYVPLAVTFQQKGIFAGAKRDSSGAFNFERFSNTAGKVHFRNKWLVHGIEGQYEFCVLIQRESDGAIGLIDPMIRNDIGP